MTALWLRANYYPSLFVRELNPTSSYSIHDNRLFHNYTMTTPRDFITVAMPVSRAFAPSLYHEMSISGAEAAFQQAREYWEYIRAQDATIASLTDSNQELRERLEAANENRDIYDAAADEEAQLYVEHAEVIDALKSQMEKLKSENKDLGKDLDVWKSDLQTLA